MEIQKKYRLAYAGIAIELLRPLAVDYVMTSEFDTDAMAFLEWNDARPEPDIEEIKRIIFALRAIEDSVENVFSDEQLAIFEQAAAEQAAAEQAGLS